MTTTEMFKGIFEKLMESCTVDESGEIQILDQKKYNEADEELAKGILEVARAAWDDYHGDEESLADIRDELDFQFDLGDDSHLSEEDEEEFGPIDGDEEFTDLMTGNDELGLGDDESEISITDFNDDEFTDISGDIDLDDAGDITGFDFDFLTDFGDDVVDDEVSTDVTVDDEIVLDDDE